MYLCQSIYNGETGKVDNCTCGKCSDVLKRPMKNTKEYIKARIAKINRLVKRITIERRELLNEQRPLRIEKAELQNELKNYED